MHTLDAIGKAHLFDATFDPRTDSFQTDDFIGGLLTTGNIGKLGWSFVAGAVTHPAGDANHPGILQRSTNASIVLASMQTTVGTATSATPLHASSIFQMRLVCRFNHFSTNILYRFGAIDGVTANAATSGIYLEKLEADTQLFLTTRTGGVSTRVAIHTPSTATWYCYEFGRAAAGNANCYARVNGGSTVSPASASDPTAVCAIGLTMDSTDSVTSTMDIDYFDILVKTQRF